MNRIQVQEQNTDSRTECRFMNRIQVHEHNTGSRTEYRFMNRIKVHEQNALQRKELGDSHNRIKCPSSKIRLALLGTSSNKNAKKLQLTGKVGHLL